MEHFLGSTTAKKIGGGTAEETDCCGGAGNSQGGGRDCGSWASGGDPSEHSWWDGGSFHGNLAKSTGLMPQARKYIEVADAPERVKQVYRRMRPHYEHLYQHRLKA